METSQEDMKFLGVFGIYREGHKITTPFRKIFYQLSVAFILPLCFIFLAQLGISTIQISRIQHHSCGENTYKTTHSMVHILSNLAYHIFPVTFSVISTSAVVYFVACIYMNHDCYWKSVMHVVPQVWKRLIATSIVIYLSYIVYIAVVIVTMLLFFGTINTQKVAYSQTHASADTRILDLLLARDEEYPLNYDANHPMVLTVGIGGTTYTFLFFVFLIIVVTGFVYLTTIWQLASVVTILEDSYGTRAMTKSKNLIKGKFWVAFAISMKLNVLVLILQFVFYNFVVYGFVWGMWKRVLVGISCLALLVPIYLYGLVLQTIVYFVCKSHHNECIENITLLEHLEEFLHLYDPNEVQLKQVCLIALKKATRSINILLDQLLTMY